MEIPIWNWSGGNFPGGPKVARRVAWIIWGSMIAGLLLFLGVTVLVNLTAPLPPQDAMTIWLLTAIACFLAAIMLPIMWLVRRWCFRRGTGEEGAIAPMQYLAGSICLWAGCEGLGLFEIVVMMLRGRPGLELVPLAVGLIVMVLTRPNAGMMQPPPGGPR